MSGQKRKIEDCVRSREDRIIRVNEKGKEFVLLNNQRKDVKQIQVDKCLDECLSIEGKRSDWLFVISALQLEIYVDSEPFCASNQQTPRKWHDRH